jgi:hypothetical protein
MLFLKYYLLGVILQKRRPIIFSQLIFTAKCLIIKKKITMHKSEVVVQQRKIFSSQRHKL